MKTTTPVSYQFEGREFKAILNHEGFKAFGSVSSRSWNIFAAGEEVTREFVLVEVEGKGFSGHSPAEVAAIKAIEAAQ